VQVLESEDSAVKKLPHTKPVTEIPKRGQKLAADVRGIPKLIEYQCDDGEGLLRATIGKRKSMKYEKKPD